MATRQPQELLYLKQLQWSGRQSQPSEVKMVASFLQLISLLILHELRASAAKSTCLTAEVVEARERKFNASQKKLNLQPDAREHQNRTTCVQAAREMHELNGRALSPWCYYIDRNDSRQPRDISFAKCLCKGCIIDGHEVNDYNSVEVWAPMLVLIKTECKDANTYRVQKMRIEVPVGCTCKRKRQESVWIYQLHAEMRSAFVFSELSGSLYSSEPQKG
ncbi:interleukin-25 isoform X3 [Oreochromis niloticus]|uniref:interleukin-25 isoform X3 n=1 Tax=Oreochromis niloticus TaxID=8128 RepID=UPI000DF280BF|nr:interleukin-25 isoform X3 [Oreochromis niloticus]